MCAWCLELSRQEWVQFPGHVFILEAFMYPTEVVDRATLMACLSRMYKDYVRFCGVVDGGNFVFSEEDWLKLLQGLDHRVLARIISNFNEQELSVMSN